MNGWTSLRVGRGEPGRVGAGPWRGGAARRGCSTGRGGAAGHGCSAGHGGATWRVWTRPMLVRKPARVRGDCKTALVCNSRRVRGGAAMALVAVLAIGLAALLVFSMSACQSLIRSAAPIMIFDARVCECPPQRGGQGLGVEFVAVNLSGRPVQRASFCLSVAEKETGGEGGSAGDFGAAGGYGGAFCDACFVLEDGLGPGEERTLFVPLEGLDDGIEADGLEIESVLVESAAFEDGELWPRGN